MHCGTRITLDPPGNSSENIYVQGNIQGNVQGGRVGFTQAVSRGFRLAFVTTGRSSRAEYWWWWLFYVPCSWILSIFGVGLETIFAIACLIPFITLGVRRLHDINMSGWWMLLWLGIFTGLILCFLAFRRGDLGDNAYGPQPNFPIKAR